MKRRIVKMNGKEIDKTDDKKFEKQYGPFLPEIKCFNQSIKMTT